jgi:membrane fusion protein, copper/silver efflux system
MEGRGGAPPPPAEVATNSGPTGKSQRPAPQGYRLSPGWLTFLVGLPLLLLAGVFYQQSLISSGAIGGTAAVATSTAGVKYVCPMRCVEADAPGECPVCGMDMSPIQTVAASPSGDTVYTCPMHPQIVQDRPGTCPICGMELVPQSDSADTEVSAASLGGVHLSPTQEIFANVTPVQPSSEAMSLDVPAIGEVQIPEGQMREVVSWQDGRVDNLVLQETGGVVKQGQHIMDLYSEELIQAQEEYLLALKAVDQLGDSGYASIADSTRRLLNASREKLVRLGMTPAQLTKLETSRQTIERVPIYAKQGGVVMDKKVAEGMYVMRGEELFSVADLSPIWVEVKVFEKDIAGIRKGDTVKFKSASAPGRTFSGRVELIAPELDMQTRTYKLRVKVNNSDLALRPGMVLDAQISFDYGDLLLLPRNAVLHTGEGDLVYVRSAGGSWEPRRVTVGRDFGERVEITAGLKPDETVAGTAAFLLDSEAQLRGVPRPVGSDE